MDGGAGRKEGTERGPEDEEDGGAPEQFNGAPEPRLLAPILPSRHPSPPLQHLAFSRNPR